VAAVKSTAVLVARRAILVAAHSKFGESSFCRFADVADFESIVPDAELDAAQARRYEALGPVVIRV
jgi:DeoR family transcriptional regulator, fructose operon transcriptional repressor